MDKGNPTPFTPPSWQAAYLASRKPGERALLVLPCDEDIARLWHSGYYFTHERLAKVWCPLGPVGSVVAVKERWAEAEDMHNFDLVAYHADGCARYIDASGKLDSSTPICEYEIDRWLSAEEMPLKFVRTFLRTTAIDLRRSDSMTGDDANAAGISHCSGQLALDVFESMWNADHPKHPWGCWAWFIQAERIEG